MQNERGEVALDLVLTGAKYLTPSALNKGVVDLDAPTDAAAARAARAAFSANPDMQCAQPIPAEHRLRGPHVLLWCVDPHRDARVAVFAPAKGVRVRLLVHDARLCAHDTHGAVLLGRVIKHLETDPALAGTRERVAWALEQGVGNFVRAERGTRRPLIVIGGVAEAPVVDLWTNYASLATALTRAAEGMDRSVCEVVDKRAGPEFLFLQTHGLAYNRAFRIAAYAWVPVRDVRRTRCDIEVAMPDTDEGAFGLVPADITLPPVNTRILAVDIETWHPRANAGVPLPRTEEGGSKGAPSRARTYAIASVLFDTANKNVAKRRVIHFLFPAGAKVRVPSATTLRTWAKDAGVDAIVPVRSEAALLRAWRELVLELDPDVLTGYNSHRYDFLWLFARGADLDKALRLRCAGTGAYEGAEAALVRAAAEHLQPDDAPTHMAFVGRRLAYRAWHRLRQMDSKGKGQNDVGELMLEHDLLAVDMLSVIKKNHSLRGYALKVVAPAVLGEDTGDGANEKMDLSYGEQWKRYADVCSGKLGGDDAALREVVAYVTQDAELVGKLMHQEKTLARMAQMSALTNATMHAVAHNGDQALVYNALLNHAASHNIVLNAHALPSMDGIAFEGGAVHAAKAGLIASDATHERIVTCLDFASLYPSIIMCFYLGFGTLKNGGDAPEVRALFAKLHRVTEAKARAEEAAHAAKLKSAGENAAKAAAATAAEAERVEATLTADDFLACFAIAPSRAQIAVMEAALKTTRDGEKRKIKDAFKRAAACRTTGDLAGAAAAENDARVADSTQRAIKVVMNTMYGFLGTSEATGLYPCKLIGMAVTALGRHLIHETEAMAHDAVLLVLPAPAGETTVTEGAPWRVFITHAWSDFETAHASGEVPADTPTVVADGCADGCATDAAPRCDLALHSETVYGDSVTGDTAVVVRYGDGRVRVCRIDALVETEEAWKPYHGDKEAADVPGLQILDEHGWTAVHRVIRHATNKALWRVRTRAGVVDCTEDHSLLRADGREVAPGAVRVGDALLHVRAAQLPTGAVCVCRCGHCKVCATAATLASRGAPAEADATRVTYVARLPYARDTVVYDLETASHHFHVGPGTLVVHNTDSIMPQLTAKRPLSDDAVYALGEAWADHLSARLATKYTAMGYDGKRLILEFEKVASFSKSFLTLVVLTHSLPLFDSILTLVALTHSLSPAPAARAQFFRGFYQGKKKQYAALKYEDRKPPKLLIKGLTAVRRDNTLFEVAAQRALIEQRVRDNDADGAWRKVKECYMRLARGNVPVAECALSGRLSRVYRGNARRAEPVVAQQMMADGHALVSGDRLSWVICKGKQPIRARKLDKVDEVAADLAVPPYRASPRDLNLVYYVMRLHRALQPMLSNMHFAADAIDALYQKALQHATRVQYGLPPIDAVLLGAKRTAVMSEDALWAEARQRGKAAAARTAKRKTVRSAKRKAPPSEAQTLCKKTPSVEQM